MINVQNIQSLTEFQRNVKRQIKRLKRTGEPQVLTVNGRAELVVQDAVSYQKMLDALEQAQAASGVREGLASMQRGEGKPLDEVFERIGKKHRIRAEE